IASSLGMAKLIFGCGYLGQRVAQLWQATGEEVFAVTRSQTRAAELAAAGIRPLLSNLLSESKVSLPQHVLTVLFSIGYDRPIDHSIHDVYVGGMAKAVDSLPDSVERFIYISSTGVYGDFAGDEVDESSPCKPTRQGG